MLAIYKKEVGSFFKGLMGFILVAVVLLVFGFETAYVCLSSGLAEFEYVPVYASLIYVVLIPIMTMRSMTEERKQKTDYLLFSNGVPARKIVLGKYFGLRTVLAIPLLIVCIYPLVLSGLGTVPLATTYGTMFAFFLLGAALTAIGLFASSLTESQIVAAVVSFGAILLTYLAGQYGSSLSSSTLGSFIALTVIVVLVGLIARYMTGSWSMAGLTAIVLEMILLLVLFLSPTTLENASSNLLSGIAVFDKLSVFKNGVFDLTGIIYYISICVLFVFFSIQSIEKRRWS